MSERPRNLIDDWPGIVSSAKQAWQPFGQAISNGFSSLADAWYQPVAGYYDASAKDSPSYSDVNFRNDVYAPIEATQEVTDPPEIQPEQPSAKGLISSGVPSSAFDYVNAELAKVYGMDKATAYQEALSNTSYQRAMADMQKAGLNPATIFGSGKSSGASGVSYVSELASGSSVGSGKGQSQKSDVFGSGSSGLISAIVGIAGAALSGKPSNYTTFSNAAKNLVNSVNMIAKGK